MRLECSMLTVRRKPADNHWKMPRLHGVVWVNLIAHASTRGAAEEDPNDAIQSDHAINPAKH